MTICFIVTVVAILSKGQGGVLFGDPNSKYKVRTESGLTEFYVGPETYEVGDKFRLCRDARRGEEVK